MATKPRGLLLASKCHVIGMCGRYTHKLTWQQIVSLYRLTLPDEEPPGLRTSYNVAPTDVMPIIRPAGNGRELAMAGWGLIPYWLKPEDLAKKPFSTGRWRPRHNQLCNCNDRCGAERGAVPQSDAGCAGRRAV